jgi:hypothetical protein
MTKQVRLVKGDTAPDIRVRLRDRDTGLVCDLSDVTAVSGKLRAAGSVTLLDTLTGSVVLPATDGELLLAIGPNTLQGRTQGLYEIEVVATLTGGAIWTQFDKISVFIRE